jgi:acyl-CoA thioesterase-1
MSDPLQPCDPHPDLVGFEFPLRHFKEALKRKRKVKIVATGSSSTAGADGILPYPPRLEMLLREVFYGRMIDILNRGIGGQEAPEELSRFESDVIGEAPALVIWQVGTNAVYRKEDYNFDDVTAAITAGLDWLADLPTDVVLMDLQYTRALVEPPGKLDLSNQMVSLISAIAGDKGVNVFKRFALMQSWVRAGIPIEELDDGAQAQLHTSDWATNCVTQALFGAIKLAVKADEIT